MNGGKKIKWRSGGIFCIALILVAAIVFVMTRPGQKRYNGKTVHELVSELDPDINSSDQRSDAQSTIMRNGNDALPEIEEILSWRSTSFKEQAKIYLIRHGWLNPPQIRDTELQSRACEAAYTLSERADVDISRLIPHLTYHFTNGTYADSSAGRALADSGSAGISVLTNLMSTGSSYDRDLASSSLRFKHINTDPGVVAALIRMANTDSNSQNRANALLYLQGNRGSPDQLVILGLKFIESEDPYERWAAAKLLSDFHDLPEAHKALEQALHDDDSRVRRTAERFFATKPRVRSN
jgi:hypothetical protein